MESQGPIQIPGAPGWWQETTARYRYDQDKSRCPICGGVGLCWAGWYHCDSLCHCIAVVEDGRTFLPIRLTQQEAETRQALGAVRQGLGGPEMTGRLTSSPA